MMRNLFNIRLSFCVFMIAVLLIAMDPSAVIYASCPYKCSSDPEGESATKCDSSVCADVNSYCTTTTFCTCKLCRYVDNEWACCK